MQAEPLYAGGLQMYALHRHRFATRTFEDFRPVPNRDGLFMVDHQLGLGVNYSLPRVIPGEWTVSAVIPLIWREFRMHVEDRVVTDRVRGLGDVSLGARMRYLWWVPGDDSQRGASLSAGIIVDLPTGESGASRLGKEVPADLQLGTGSYGLTLSHAGIYSDNRWEVIIATQYHWRSVGVGGSDYDFGDAFSNEFELKYRVIQEKFPGNTMFVSLGAKFDWRDFDRDDGVRVKHTGGWGIYASPKVQWHPRPWFELKAIFDVPVYADTHGVQLRDEVSFRFSFAWRFTT